MKTKRLLNPTVVLAATLLVLAVVLIWRRSTGWRGTTGQSVKAEEKKPVALEPSFLRERLIDQIQKESSEQLFDKLTEKLDDIAYTVTGSGLGYNSTGGTYAWAVTIVPNLARVRKILQDFEKLPKPFPKLKKMLLEGASGYDKLIKEDNRQGIEYNLKKRAGPLLLHDVCRKKRIDAQVGVYLLTEWSCWDALPTMVRVFDQEGELPAPRLYLFYSMHLLAGSHPKDQLSEASKLALAKYLEATKDHVPIPDVILLPSWNSPNDHLDLRKQVLGKKTEDDSKAPTLKIRVYPRWFEEYEHSFGVATKKRHEYKNRMALEVHEWYALLKTFVAATYKE